MKIISSSPLHRSVAILVCLLVFACCALAKPTTSEVARWDKLAGNVTITRDDWGIAHVVGKTDADAVFGMIYAQAEDDLTGSRPTTSTRWDASPRQKANPRSGKIYE